MMRSTKQFLSLESLEERLTPAFDFFYNPASDVWTVTQVQDDGPATITVDGANDLIVTDGAGGPVTVGVANGGLTINMMDNSGDLPPTVDLLVELDGFMAGNVSIDLGQGSRLMNLDAPLGGLVAIGGNLTINAGNGDHTVEFIAATSVDVGGSLNMDLGLGADLFDLSAVGTSLSVGSNLTMRNVNSFFDGGAAATVAVGGSFNFYSNRDNLDNDIFLGDLGSLVAIGGSLNYLGGNGDDLITIGDGTPGGNVFIGGNANFNLGNSIGTIATNDVGLSSTIIGGSLSVIGGMTLPGVGGDFVTTDVETVIGGNIRLSMGAVGENTVDLAGTIGGSSVSIIGGIDIDTVTYAMVGSNVRLYSLLSLGDDDFTFGDGITNPTLRYLYIDFGFGNDSWTNNFLGPFTFPAYLRNLP